MQYARSSSSGILISTVVAFAACAPDAGIAPLEPVGEAAAFARGGVDAPTVVSGGFDAPEAAAHDPVADVYLISNVGDLFSDANDGFISRLAPDGTILDLRWIEGDDTNPLISPTGMMVQGRTLYIVDRTALRRYDLRREAWLAPITLPDDGLFYNDVCGAGEGRIFVTATDLSIVLEDNVDARGALYVVEGGSASPFLAGTDVGNPNGCTWHGGVTWVSMLPDGGIYNANPSGRVRLAAATPAAGLLDGIVFAGGDYYVTSWIANGVVRVPANGRGDAELFFEVESPASLGFDARRRQLIVPSLFGNEVVILPLR
jgi:sugar lactone lactonase YvrE